MEIHLRRGIGKLRFGMTRPEVEKLFGKPSREITNSNDENELIWEYVNHKLRLTFYQNENDRLGYIRCSHPNLTFNKSNIIDEKIDNVVHQIERTPQFWEIEDYGTFKTYFLEGSWLTLNVEYERVTDIELGVPFKNDDEYDWPN